MSEADIIFQDDISVSALDDVEIVSGGDNVIVVNSPIVDVGGPWGSPQPWVTDHYYTVSPVTSIVAYGGSLYFCLTPHTSGVFVDDLAAGKWLLFVSKGDTGTPGTNGTDGVDGDTGPQGNTGPQGPQGVSGTDVCGMYGGTIVESHSGNAVTFAVKTRTGADPSGGTPVVFTFQNGTGGIDFVSVTSALSITIPSGATLGTGNATAFRLWIAAFNDAGTVRLSVIYPTPPCGSGNIGAVFPPEGMAVSTSQPPGNSSRGFYTQSVAVTSKYWCWIAYATYESGLTTAGTWNASPTVIVLVGPTTPRPGSLLQTVVGGVGATNYNGNNTWAAYAATSAVIWPISAANQLEVNGNCDYMYLRSFAGVGGLAGLWSITVGLNTANGIMWAAPELYTAPSSNTTDGPVVPGGAIMVYWPGRVNTAVTFSYMMYCSSSAQWGVDFSFNALIVKEYMG